jgi:3-oxocholest-4-en-26-oyl-CoA dehydrogenase beta subunit
VEFSYSDDERSLRELAGRQFAAHSSDDQRKALRRAEQPYDPALWSALAQGGLLGTAIDVVHGGSGLDFIALGILLEEQGRTLGAVPLLPTLVMGALPLERFGSSQQQQLLRRIVRGDVLLTGAFEEGSGRDPSNIATQALPSPRGWQLRGTKSCVPYGAQAHYLLVPAATPEGARMFLIPADAPGLRIEPQRPTSGEPQAQISLEGVGADQTQIIGAPLEDVVRWTLHRAEVGYAALQLGVLAEALRRAALYASEREQFGRPIGSFQAVQHRLADCYIELESLRSVYLRAVWALEEEREATAEVRTLSWWRARAGHRVSHAVQHVHGGLGADVEYPIHAFFLHATQLSLALGGGAPSLAQLGTQIARGDIERFT